MVKYWPTGPKFMLSIFVAKHHDDRIIAVHLNHKKTAIIIWFTNAEAKEMSHHLSPKVKVQLTAICSHLCSPAITHFSLCRSGNVSFERQNVKGQKKNSNISQGDFNTAAYLEGSQWEWLLLEGIGRCS